MLDKSARIGTIIEIGITNQEELTAREHEKRSKYIHLADELKALYKLRRVDVIPLVWTWEGLVTKKFKHYAKHLGLSNKVLGYIQSRILKRTLESVTNDKSNDLDIQKQFDYANFMIDDSKITKMEPNEDYKEDKVVKKATLLNSEFLSTLKEINAPGSGYIGKMENSKANVNKEQLTDECDSNQP